MRWSNVAVIFSRELRDQIRDRRTLFMIFVLPILLYPLLGYGMLQFTATLAQRPRTVVVIGAANLPASPRLLNPAGDGFDPALFDDPGDASRLLVRVERPDGPWGDPLRRKQALRRGDASAAVIIPGDLPAILRREGQIEVPVEFNSVDEPSQITYRRLREMLDRWGRRIVSARLDRDHKPIGYAEPIRLLVGDVATPSEVGSNVWSRLFPFLLVVMALTGAFYPAVDLCAGEKERGTMETLLISPASRSEIVLGKFLTVMIASVLTAVLNLVSMGITGIGIAWRISSLAASPDQQAAGAAVALTAPTVQSAFWMLVILIPLAAFFAAICVALAVLARSMKEGQYYMTPLYLISMPLIFLSLAPEVELNLFYSLVPITGVALLLRALILGGYDVAFRYFLPVLLPMMVYAAVSLRWAIDQFQREDVLFREAERFSLGTWLRHLYRDREPTPTAGESVLCFALILASSWLFMSYRGEPEGGPGPWDVIAGQLFIAIPPVLMALLLTSSPRRTLRLRWPEGRYLFLAAALAFALNPIVNELEPIIQRLFPVPDAIKAAFGQLMGRSAGLATMVTTFALVPAICEELAFRGLILSGLQRQHRTRSAILLSALMFGFLHVLMSLFQQLFNATLLGIVLGLLAVRSRSLLPGIVFHFLNNAIAVTFSARIRGGEGGAIAGWLYRDPAEGRYHVVWVVAGAIVSCGLLYVLWSRDRGRTDEPEAIPAEAQTGSCPTDPACAEMTPD